MKDLQKTARTHAHTSECGNAKVQYIYRGKLYVPQIVNTKQLQHYIRQKRCLFQVTIVINVITIIVYMCVKLGRHL